MLLKVSKLFYDKIYDHKWIGKYFEHVNQEHIENQQVDFMSQAFGGPKIYRGRMPLEAHVHIFIDEALFELRHQLLVEALKECGAHAELIRRWEKVDNAFKGKMMKTSPDKCVKRFNSDKIINFPS